MRFKSGAKAGCVCVSVRRLNLSGRVFLEKRGASAPLRVGWFFLVDPHDDPAIDGDRIERERETFAVLGCPCDADVSPSCVVAVSGYIEQAVARAV